MSQSETRVSNFEDPTRAAQGIQLQGKKVLVVGLARSGVSAANLLARIGARVTVTDVKPEAELTNSISRLEGTVERRLGGHEQEDFVNSDLIVLSPGVPTYLKEVQAARNTEVPVISEVELAYRFLRGRFVGVTGSNGKTTTTTLIGEILRSAGLASVVAGNIGEPLSGFVTARMEGHDDTVYIVEMSSFQLETISKLKCDIAVLLNITSDHMDRYSSLAEYEAAKKRILLNQTGDDYAVVNRDDPASWRLAIAAAASLFPFSSRRSLSEGTFIENETIVVRRGGKGQEVLPVSEVRLKGEHNLQNVLAAVAVASLLGVSPEQAAQAIGRFSGVEHRLEWVRRLRGIEYYNDSKATNLDSAIKALSSFERKLVVIMGGLDKGADFEKLRSLVAQKVRRVILIGAAADRISSALNGTAPISHAASLHEAVELASESAEGGDVILLAPACASFDMFENYEHRGRVFKHSVMALN